MLTNPIFLWLLVGIIFIAANNFVKRYNLMYAAYAAFTICFFLVVGVMRMPDPVILPYYEYFVYAQILCFLLAILGWRYVFRHANPGSKLGRTKEFYDEIMGKTAIVGKGGINAISGGEVTINGEEFDAKLASSEEGSVEAGSKVIIQDVVDDVLIVTPKN